MKLSLRNLRPTRTAVGIASLATGMALTALGLALAAHSGQSVPAPPANPTSASQIQNIDQVKTAIKGYYGDTLTNVIAPGTDPDAAKPTYIHTFDPDGAYAHEVAAIAAKAGKTLANNHTKNAGKAVLFDVDDTTLNTYSYEIFSNFVYNPVTNGDFVTAADPRVFPAVPGMVDLEKKAEAHGYDVYFLTGRPLSQEPATIANLLAAGYDNVTADNVFTKDATADTEPWLASCIVPDPANPGHTKFGCTTIQYKSMTRQYIESQGADIVANFGDQFSDLKGGFADSTYKIPNPMYYLP